MIYGLGFSLEIVRIVLENEMNIIYVCKDKSSQSGLFYTCITIKEKQIQKEVLNFLIRQEEIKRSTDYIGNFVFEESLNLLFLYRKEKRLETYIEMYADSFEKRCYLCKRLVGSAQATQFPIEWLYMILSSNNINVNADGSIYFNYFLDFASLYKLKEIKGASFNKLAECLFIVLSKGYEKVYNPQKYPKDLRLFYKKMMMEGFDDFTEFYKYLNMMPRELEKEEGIGYWLKKTYVYFKKQAVVHGGTAIILILIIVTGIFCIDGIIKKNKEVEAFNQAKASQIEPYKGLYDIGTVRVHQTDDGGE